MERPGGEVREVEVSEHHGGGEEGGSGVGDALAGDVLADMPGALLKDGNILADVGSWHDAGPAAEPCHDVGDQIAIQVGGDHHVELVGPAHKLHAGVVNDHLLCLDLGVLLCNLPEFLHIPAE